MCNLITKSAKDEDLHGIAIKDCSMASQTCLLLPITTIMASLPEGLSVTFFFARPLFRTLSGSSERFLDASAISWG